MERQRLRVPLRKQARDDLTRQIMFQLRHAFALVDEFRTLGVPGSGSPGRDLVTHAVVLHAVIQDAQYCFKLAAKTRTEDARVSADNESCLHDLGKLLQALRAHDPPSAHELEHALDGLIVQFVQVTPRAAPRRLVDAAS